jgi:hypothetical protein
VSHKRNFPLREVAERTCGIGSSHHGKWHADQVQDNEKRKRAEVPKALFRIDTKTMSDGVDRKSALLYHMEQDESACNSSRQDEMATVQR